jgi:hypothetical protein
LLASTLVRSRPLSYVPKPRLQARLPSRLLLPASYAGELVVSLGEAPVSGVVQGRSYCIAAVATSGVQLRAVTAPLQGGDSPSCRFGRGTLDALGKPGVELRLILSNNLGAGADVRTVQDTHGMLNLYETGVILELFDSPFFHEDALVQVVSPGALFDSQKTIVQLSATSRLSAPGSSLGRHLEVVLGCRLYEPDFSLTQPRFETSECSFTSSELDTLRVKIPAGALRAAEYRLQVSLNN